MSVYKKKVAVIGLGYVGLPLAIGVARENFSVTGVDIKQDLLDRLAAGERVNKDIPQDLYPIPDTLKLSSSPPPDCDVYIVCVPTPDVYGENRMDATAVIETCKSIGKVMPKHATVVIESTVTPGSTLGIFKEAVASTRGSTDFYMAYSPERLNPGPTFHDYEKVNHTKLIGCDTFSKSILSRIYRSIYDELVFVGVEEAELAKTFENAQRDMNIALMNELALHCYMKDLNYDEVIQGLRTKVSSPKFISGLVGGHCISVDPYFLAEYYGDAACLPLHGRIVNETYIERLSKIAIDCNEGNGPIVICGRSYKPGVVDKRNSGAIKLYKYLTHAGRAVHIHDTLVDGRYRGPSPTLMIGAVNHNPDLNIYKNYLCDPETDFINIGQGFTEWQCAPFRKVYKL